MSRFGSNTHPHRRAVSGRHASRGLTPVALAAAAAAAAIALLPAAARAQGTLAEQGFGYPPGQLSTFSLGMAGATAESDPITPVNPAALSGWGRPGVFFQYAPEFRETSAGGSSDRTTTTRFPLVAAATPLWRRTTLGVAASTFLDRTFSTRRTTRSTLTDGTVVDATSSVSSSGAANDVRLALAWVPVQGLSVGVGVHALTGQNTVTIGLDLVDTATTNPTSFLGVSEQRTLGFSGLAVSAGIGWRPVRPLLLTASGRHGGTLRLSAGDTLLARAGVPDRYGVGVRFDGVPGASFSARYGWEGWSSMQGLGSTDVRTFDAVDYAAGADVQGPRFGRRVLSLRLGARTRTLPFAAAGAKVRETAFAGGAGVPLATERVVMDLALQRARRSASGVGATELSWTFGIGFTVRP